MSGHGQPCGRRWPPRAKARRTRSRMTPRRQQSAQTQRATWWSLSRTRSSRIFSSTTTSPRSLPRLEQLAVLDLAVELTDGPLLLPVEVDPSDERPSGPRISRCRSGAGSPSRCMRTRLTDSPTSRYADPGTPRSAAPHVCRASAPSAAGRSPARPVTARTGAPSRRRRPPGPSTAYARGPGPSGRLWSRQSVDNGDVCGIERRLVNVHEVPPLAAAGAIARDVDPFDRPRPHRQAMQDGSGTMTDHRAVQQLRRSCRDQARWASSRDSASGGGPAYAPRRTRSSSPR